MSALTPTGISPNDTTYSTPEVPQEILDRFKQLNLDPTVCFFVNGSEKKDNQCPICLLDFSNTDLLIKENGCQHTFCCECFFQSTANSKKCPMCRRSVESDPLSPLERLKSHMLGIWLNLLRSRRQLEDYWGESGVSESAYDAAYEAYHVCERLHTRLASTLIHGSLSHESVLNNLSQSDVQIIKALLDSALGLAQAVVDKLGDWSLSRADGLSTVMPHYIQAAADLQRIITLYPDLDGQPDELADLRAAE